MSSDRSEPPYLGRYERRPLVQFAYSSALAKETLSHIKKEQYKTGDVTCILLARCVLWFQVGKTVLSTVKI